MWLDVACNFEANTVKNNRKDNLEIGLFYYNKEIVDWGLKSKVAKNTPQYTTRDNHSMKEKQAFAFKILK